jgi:hypothetical protein
MVVREVSSNRNSIPVCQQATATATLNFQQWNGCASARYASTFASSIMYPSPWTNSDEEGEDQSPDEVEGDEESSEEATGNGTYSR